MPGVYACVPPAWGYPYGWLVGHVRASAGFLSHDTLRPTLLTEGSRRSISQTKAQQAATRQSDPELTPAARHMDGPGNRRLQRHQPFDRLFRPADCNNRSGKQRRLRGSSTLALGSHALRLHPSCIRTARYEAGDVAHDAEDGVHGRSLLVRVAILAVLRPDWQTTAPWRQHMSCVSSYMQPLPKNVRKPTRSQSSPTMRILPASSVALGAS